MKLSLLFALLWSSSDAFDVNKRKLRIPFSLRLSQDSTTTASFIDTELRGAAMRLHTREQAPKEGQAPAKEKPKEPYIPTCMDYLRFLVDSQQVYQVLEDIVNERDELAVFRDTGLERTERLEHDIQFMMKEYKIERPEVGEPGKSYAKLIRELGGVPAFVCHYYNHYFAHTAGGRMIGKQMSALLLDKRTLEFYKVRSFPKGCFCSEQRISFLTLFLTNVVGR